MKQIDEESRRIVLSGRGHRHGPVVFCNATPEDVDHDDSQKRKERFEQGAVDFAVCRLADMRTDHVVKDLTDCKQNCREDQVH